MRINILNELLSSESLKCFRLRFYYSQEVLILHQVCFSLGFWVSFCIFGFIRKHREVFEDVFIFLILPFNNQPTLYQ